MMVCVCHCLSSTADLGIQGIVHGGLTAALIDNAAGVASFVSGGLGSFTANLDINYRKPVAANQWVMLRSRAVAKEGRKIHVYLSLEPVGPHHDPLPDQVMIQDAAASQPRLAKLRSPDPQSPSAAERSSFVEATALMIRPRGVINPAVLSASVS